MGINEFKPQNMYISSQSRCWTRCAAIKWEFCYSALNAAIGTNNDFGPLHGLWAWKHYSTYILVWISMNSNRKICIIARRAIIERVALLYSGILPFGALGIYTAEWRFRPATWLVGIETLSYIQISIVVNVFDPRKYVGNTFEHCKAHYRHDSSFCP
jgi:hypothetical protein